MAPISFAAFLLASLVVARSAQAYQWPSPMYDALETLLYEGRRSDGSNLASTQHPCKNRGSTEASIGAEWLRLAYHDVANHNAERGTGGLDASIVFELDRRENAGMGMVRSLEDFSTFSSKYISRSDVIALGTTLAVASCNGPILRFRGGRVDAVVPDEPGVPEPHQDLATHTTMFQRQGFSPAEMITLVACGHTIGGVRSSDHPDIVPPGPDPEVDTFELFDTTGRQFDNTVVTQFLDGTTTNPLVTVSNTTLAADRRIFDSDGGATMRALADPEAFQENCGVLLERMLNLVPSTVTLTEEITLLPAKVASALLTIEDNQLVFKATFRLVHPATASISRRNVTMLWCDRYGDEQDCKNGHAKSALSVSKSTDLPDLSPVTLRTGQTFTHYRFVVPINEAESISMFWFSVDEGDGSKATTHDNGGNGYPVLQDNVLYIPARSSVTLEGTEPTHRRFELTSAVKSSLSPSRVWMSVFDSATPNYDPPLQADLDMTLDSTMEPIAGYSFYRGGVDDFGAQLTVDMKVDVDGTTYTEDYMQTFVLNTNIPSNPPSAVIPVDVSPPKPRDTNDGISNYLRTPGTIWNINRVDFGIGLLAIWLGSYLL